MTGSFKGKVALITGGACGIGRATALAFAQAGAQVCLADVDAAGGEDTVRLIRQNGGEATFLACDVSMAAEVQAMIAATVSVYGRLDCAFNNAGNEGSFDPTAECSEENFDRVIAVNLKGVWLCTKYEILQMLTQKGGGAVVNTASVAGLVAERGFPAYAAAKGGVIQLTRTAAIEYAATGIRINAICPGVVRTPMMDRAMKAMRPSAMAFGAMRSPVQKWVTDRLFGFRPLKNSMFKLMQPIGRPGEPEEIAAAVLYLCSDSARFVTGHAMVLDGGMTAQ